MKFNWLITFDICKPDLKDVPQASELEPSSSLRCLAKLLFVDVFQTTIKMSSGQQRVLAMHVPCHATSPKTMLQ